jgi:hypothetical protein
MPVTLERPSQKLEQKVSYRVSRDEYLALMRKAEEHGTNAAAATRSLVRAFLAGEIAA